MVKTVLLTLAGAIGVFVSSFAQPSFCVQSNFGGGINPTSSVQTITITSGMAMYFTFTGINGTSYRFSNCKIFSDTYLRLYNSSGTLIYSVDDYGPVCSNTSSSMEWKCTLTGTYYIHNSQYSCGFLSQNTPFDYQTFVPVVPTITGFTKNIVTQGEVVTLTGTGFMNVNNILLINTSTGLSLNIFNFQKNSNSIVFYSTEYFRTGRFQLNGSFGSVLSNTLTVIPVFPTVTGISPNPAPKGGELIFTGQAMDKIERVYYRTTGGIDYYGPNYSSNNTIRFGIPNNALSSILTLSGYFGLSTTAFVTFTTPSAPTISGVNPTSYLRGMIVTIFGVNLRNVNSYQVPAQTGIYQTSIFSIYNNTLIGVYVPQNAINGPITLLGGFGSVQTQNLTVRSTATPTISRVNPNPIVYNNVVSVFGSGLEHVNSYSLRTIYGNSFNYGIYPEIGRTILGIYLNSEIISAPITLSGIFGAVVTPTITIVGNGSPTVSSISPNPATRGEFVTVVGTNLNNINYVFYNSSGGLTYDYPSIVTYNYLTFPVNSYILSGALTLSGSFGNATTPVLSVTSTFARPTVTGITPNPVTRNGTITILGSLLNNVSQLTYRTAFGNSSVNINNSNSNRLIFNTPNDIITGIITLSGLYGAIQTSSLTVTLPHTITSSFCISSAQNRGGLAFNSNWQTVTGVAGTASYWSFTGNNLSTYRFSTCGAQEDTYLRLYDRNGTFLTSVDDNGPFCSTSASSLEWTCYQDGLYYILLTRFSCEVLSNNTNLLFQKPLNYSLPTVTGISPNTASLYTYVTITGQGFSTLHTISHIDNSGRLSYRSASAISDNMALFYVDSYVGSGRLTLSGSNLFAITPFLTVSNSTVTTPSFFCTSNVNNLGSLVLTTSLGTTVLPSGNPSYYQFYGTQGKTHRFSTCGATEDTYIRIYNASGSIVASNDDYGPDCNSLAASLDFTPSSSANYYVLISKHDCIALSSNTSLKYYISSPLPSVSGITFVKNPTNAYSTVTILGQGLLDITSLRYKTTSATAFAYPTLNNGSRIEFFINSNAATGIVTLLGSNRSLYSPILYVTILTPSVTSVSTFVGNGGLKTGVVNGSNFNNVETIWFATSSGNQSTIPIISNPALSFSLPSNALNQPVTLTGSFGRVITPAAGSGINVSTPGTNTPMISNISPNPANRSGTVIIIGSNLDKLSAIGISTDQGYINTTFAGTSGSIYLRLPSNAITGELKYVGPFGTVTGQVLSIVGSLLQNISEESSNINIYPNPSKGTLKIEMPEHLEAYYLKVFDTNSKELQIQLTNHEFQINEEGVYIIEIITGKKVIRKKVVVIK